MQHGARTKFHLIDRGWNYGEKKWELHAWARHGHTRMSEYVQWKKLQFIRDERRRGKREIAASMIEEVYDARYFRRETESDAVLSNVRGGSKIGCMQ